MTECAIDWIANKDIKFIKCQFDNHALAPADMVGHTLRINNIGERFVYVGGWDIIHFNPSDEPTKAIYANVKFRTIVTKEQARVNLDRAMTELCAFVTTYESNSALFNIDYYVRSTHMHYYERALNDLETIRSYTQDDKLFTHKDLVDKCIEALNILKGVIVNG